MKPVRILAPLVLVLASCDGSDHNTTPYPYDVVECDQSYHTTITEPSREVITNVHRFREIYGVTDLNSQSEVPSVDFDNRQVIAIHAGGQANPGHGLRVDDVVQTDHALNVRYTAIEENQSGECSYPDVVVYPYCFIAVDQSDLPVTYSRSTEERSC